MEGSGKCEAEQSTKSPYIIGKHGFRWLFDLCKTLSSPQQHYDYPDNIETGYESEERTRRSSSKPIYPILTTMCRILVWDRAQLPAIRL